MTEPTEGPERLRAYLLGTMDQAAAAELEERYFRDTDVFDLLQSTLDDLTDDYVNGNLTPDERRQFERLHAGGAAGQARIDFSRTLVRNVGAKAAPLRPPFVRSVITLFRQQAAPLQLALAAGFMILLIGPTIALTRVTQLGNAVEELRAHLDVEREAARSAAADAARERGQRQNLENTLAGLSTSAFSLLPGSTRGDGTRLALPAGIGFARLELALEQIPPLPLRAVIRNAGGATVWSQEIRDSIGPSGPVVTVPNAVLPAGDYEASVYAVGSDGRADEVASFAFRIERR